MKGFIKTSKGTYYGSICLRTDHPFFVVGEPIIVNETDDSIIFSKPTLDYIGNVYTPQKSWNSVKFNIPADIEVHKRFYFDEDSTEDEMIIYK